MTSKLPRLNVTFPQELFATIERDAELSERSISGQIIWSLKQHYRDRKQEADLFTPTQLREAKRVVAPVFLDPDPPVSERASKLRDSLGQEKS